MRPRRFVTVWQWRCCSQPAACSRRQPSPATPSTSPGRAARSRSTAICPTPPGAPPRASTSGTRRSPATTSSRRCGTSATSRSTRSSSTPPSSSTTRIHRPSARRTPTATTSTGTPTTTAASCSTRATRAATACCLPRHAAQHPVRLRSRRFVRTRMRRPTSSGTRRAASPAAAGRSRSAFRSRPSGTRTWTRRRGGSCCTATTRAIFTISSSRCAFRATATASSATRTC